MKTKNIENINEQRNVVTRINEPDRWCELVNSNVVSLTSGSINLGPQSGMDLMISASMVKRRIYFVCATASGANTSIVGRVVLFRNGVPVEELPFFGTDATGTYLQGSMSAFPNRLSAASNTTGVARNCLVVRLGSTNVYLTPVEVLSMADKVSVIVDRDLGGGVVYSTFLAVYSEIPIITPWPRLDNPVPYAEQPS